MAVMNEQIKKEPILIRDMLLASASVFADKPAILVKREEGFVAYTYRRLRSDAEALGTALAARGLVGKRLLIVGDNGYEWALALLASLFVGAIAMPVDKTLSAPDLSSLCEYAKPDLVLYSDSLFETVSALPESVEKHSFSSIDGLLEEGRHRLSDGASGLLSSDIDQNAPALILFTSGSIGAPQGVMLSNKNLCFTVSRAPLALGITAADSFLSLLPLHHIYELVCDLLVPLTVGASVAFGEGLHAIMKNMGEVHPTVLVTAPVIAEALYRKVQKLLLGAYGKRGDAEIAVSNFLPRRLARPIKKKLFEDIHRAFGGSLRMVVCGGAPVGAHIIKGLCDVGLLAVEGYGLCEGAGVVTVNPAFSPRYGSVGKALPDSTVDIYNIGEDGMGEIRIKSDGVMLGYFGDEKATAEVLRGGWLYTGDLGYVDEKGYLYVTGRKKNLLVSRAGKNIFPEEIEALLMKEPFVREAVVVGFINEAKRDYDLVAVVYPDREKLTLNYGEGYTVRDAENEIEGAIAKVNAVLPEHKRLGMFVLRENEFEKNSSRKIRRVGVAASVINEYQYKKRT